ncbi:response regulator [Paenibacillus tengchongensis]|uniref:response regulator n=1 Tax=Paenibacillus tengchongensis TaxID=2608684 RepID=UPI00124D9227|nr:response regulator [Paenibacillus tengchongensis]
MNINQQVRLAAFAFIALFGGTVIIAFTNSEGWGRILISGFGAVGILLGGTLILGVSRNIARGVERIARITSDIARGTTDINASFTERDDEFGQLARSFHSLAVDLQHKREEERVLRIKAEEQAWINDQVSEIALLLQGSVKLTKASRIFISKLAGTVGASYGAIYLKNDDHLLFAAGYAFDAAAALDKPIPLGSGLVGQCALDREIKELRELPGDYIRVHSGLGQTVPSLLYLVPVLYEQDVVAVIELAGLKEFSPRDRQLIERTAHNMGVIINTLADVARIEDLLRESQLQKEELEAQTEELQAQTEELSAQTQELAAQTEELSFQREELRLQAESLLTSNESLKREMELTAEQKLHIEAQTAELAKQAQSLADANLNLQQEIELTARQKEEIAAQAGDLLNQKEELEAQTLMLQNQTVQLQEQKEELEAQTQELRAQTEELWASQESLRQQVEITDRQNAEIAAQAEDLAESNRNLKREFELTARQKAEISTQAEQLLGQKEELEAQTLQLQKQTLQLQEQKEELETQTEELRTQTEELTVSQESLQEQIKLTEAQKDEIKAQAEEIFLAAQYKSEFLANVSHELRTPLNSLLILSQILAENKDGNLDTKQLEYVHTIFSAGKDLLQLIDEILDLAKMEAGKMSVVFEPVVLQHLSTQLYRHFEQQAKKKHIRFDVHCDSRLPEALVSDGHRIQQVMNNLLSNALKFTPEHGSVSLFIRTEGEEIVFSVSDTGIGIAGSKLESIFEAFQQADGTTSRKYGGTGLGLTICRELASMLGGRIEVDSAEGKGSTFSLFLPAEPAEADIQALVAATDSSRREAELDKAAQSVAAEEGGFRESFIPDISISNPKLLQHKEMDDDRENLLSGDTVLLIIEEDAEFASILLRLARSRGFKAIVAFQGDQGLALAYAYKPDAILLDLHLPVLDGRSIISRLKSRPELRHIPVHVISTAEENQQSLVMGALSFWKKPSDVAELEAAFLQIETYIRRPVKSLLIVEDNKTLRSSLVEFIAHPDVRIVAVGTGREAMEQLASHHFDCMVLDLGLSDITGFDLLEQIKTNRKLQTLPVIIYTGKDLSKIDEQRLRHYAESIVLKNVRSMERLYDETALYLHRKHADLPRDKQLLIEKLHNPEAAFAGKSILLVDDDMRNIFALSSVLEGYNMDIAFAQNGREALEHLQEHPGVELVFMDIMMPEMDGYETMQRIRSMPEYDHLVIIALTARALEEDRMKCLEAGASDYISKPINTTQLVTVLKAWLIQ